jgi:hypothetical protein
MATDAQIAANQKNAEASTGPRTPEGKAIVAANAVKLGLFTVRCVVRPEEQDEFHQLSAGILADLNPEGVREQAYATEIIASFWRLRRCAAVEENLGVQATVDPMEDAALAPIQAAVDRARTQAHGIIRRATIELRRLQADRNPPATPPAKQTQSAPRPPSIAPAEQTQFETESLPEPTPLTPRGAPCPCGSGIKYKRCCGINSPAALHLAA